MNEMKNKEWKENKPMKKTRTHTPLNHIRKVKENLTLASTMEQRKMLGVVWYMFSYNNFQFLSACTKHPLKVADKSGMAIKKLELKKYFEKRRRRKKGSPLSNRILTS